MTRVSRRAAGWLALIAIVVAMSACSPAGGSTGSTANALTAKQSGRTVPSTTSPPAGPTRRRAATPPPATPPPAPPSAQPPSAQQASARTPNTHPASTQKTTDCTNRQLAVRSAPAQGGDSHAGIIVIFTNISRRACTIYGYPGAAILDRGGRQIVQAARTLGGYLGGCGCTTPEHLRLSHGQPASALIEGDTGGGAECLRGVAILTTPPNTTRSTRIPFEAYSCHVQVHPVLRGTAGTKS